MICRERVAAERGGIPRLPDKTAIFESKRRPAGISLDMVQDFKSLRLGSPFVEVFLESAAGGESNRNS